VIAKPTVPTNKGAVNKCVMICNADQERFYIIPEEEPPPEFADLVRVHEDRLRALLDRPVILVVHWSSGDAKALAVC
jgi:hypothetical protein